MRSIPAELSSDDYDEAVSQDPGRRTINQREMWGAWWSLTRDPVVRKQFRLARAGLELPTRLKARPPRHGLWAVTMVKNEIDILADTVHHLLGQGVDRVLVADNLSTDGTRELIAEMAREDPRIIAGLDREVGYYQSAKMTELARFAARHGARWIIPFDADEWWFAQGTTLRDFYEAAPTGAHSALIHNAFPLPGLPWRQKLRLDLTPAAMTKVSYRFHPAVILGIGNHWALRAGQSSRDLRILHVPWRTFDQLSRKLRQGAAALDAADLPENVGPHWRGGGRQTEEALMAKWNDLLQGAVDPELSWSPSGGPYREWEPGTWDAWPTAL